MMGGMDWGWNWMFSGGVTMLLFWVIVIGLAVLLLRGWLGPGSNSTTTNPPRHETSSPQEILQRRYAAGEINQEQYEQMKTTLNLS